jgi:hypothetical protein
MCYLGSQPVPRRPEAMKTFEIIGLLCSLECWKGVLHVYAQHGSSWSFSADIVSRHDQRTQERKKLQIKFMCCMSLTVFAQKSCKNAHINFVVFTCHSFFSHVTSRVTPNEF